MQKQKKQFLVVLSVLVLCIAAYFAVSSFAKKEQEKEKDTEAEITAARVDTDKIDAFSYQAGDETYKYRKDGDKWVCESEPSLALDTDSMNDMLGNLKKVQAKEKLTDYDSLADYGLDQPQNEITVTCGTDTQTFAIGDYNEMLGQYYLKIEGDDSVYLIDSGLQDAFSRQPESLAESTESTEDTQ